MAAGAGGALSSAGDLALLLECSLSLSQEEATGPPGLSHERPKSLWCCRQTTLQPQLLGSQDKAQTG